MESLLEISSQNFLELKLSLSEKKTIWTIFLIFLRQLAIHSSIFILQICWFPPEMTSWTKCFSFDWQQEQWWLLADVRDTRSQSIPIVTGSGPISSPLPWPRTLTLPADLLLPCLQTLFCSLSSPVNLHYTYCKFSDEDVTSKKESNSSQPSICGPSQQINPDNWSRRRAR